ncbi:hypothetical protein HG264_04200 [Pseudomonas sp. gcc21]|uniref:hypothetical protein n=1 Tax=Pseudomonas sp. gcc21 TaxID=2726989 RepID=UPI0014529697|nr:hypothetical protein [Pseudomonas sp. gcc21]QJD58173.1 hypothetical protein HG264_04200 [Pseudomonas sp. gcc21]
MIDEIATSGSAVVDHLTVDGVSVDTDYMEDAPSQGCEISFRIHTHSQSLSTFHQNLTALLASGSEISRGVCPSQYYIVGLDAYSEDIEPHWAVEAISTACKAVSLLAKVAHYHDSKSETGCLQLVFVDAGSAQSIKPLLINTVVSEEIISICRDIDITLLEQLAQAAPESDPHYASRRGVFYATVSEFLGGPSAKEDSFKRLLSGWTKFSELFQANLNTYFSGFAFHKAKREVAEAEFDIASQYSKILGDITGKLLAIPVSFAALIALSKSDDLLESIFLVLGLTFASLVISGIVHNQRRHFSLIKQAKNIVIDSIDGKTDSYPEDLRVSIEKMKTFLKVDECRLQWTLAALQILAWIPALIGTAYLYYA